MNQIYDINFAMTALAEAGWKPVQTDQYWLLIPVEGRHGLFFISFYIHSDDQMLSARGNIPIYVPKDKEAVILEFINYGNYRIPVGNFEFDVDSQQVFFRLGWFFEDVTLNAQLLHNVVHEISQAVQNFWLAIQAIVQNDVSVSDAFRRANSK
jgi:hypothetical protein